MSLLRKELFKNSSKQIFDSGFIATSNLISAFAGFVSGLVIGRLVTPEYLGTFRSFGIITTYLNILHLGLFDSLQRELPYILESERYDEARKSLSASAAWLCLVLTIATIGFIGLSVSSLIRRDYFASAGWFVQPFVLSGTLYGGLLSTLFRTGHEFRKLAKASLWGSIANIALLPCLLISPFYGLCFKSSVASTVNPTVLYYKKPLKFNVRWNSKELIRHIKIGAPLFGVGYVESSLWLATESFLVLSLFGIEGLGLYAFAIAIREAANAVASAVNQVYVPKIASSYSRYGSYLKAWRLSSKATLASCLINLVMAVAIILFLPHLITLLIPRYSGAIPIIKLIAIFPILKALELPLYVFKAANQRRWYASYVISGYFVFIAMSLLLGRMYGLNGFMIGVISGRAGMIVIGNLGLFLGVRREEG
jgi:O-antigen/teichoic acid export membrane protein